jgi:hypothetical protein
VRRRPHHRVDLLARRLITRGSSGPRISLASVSVKTSDSTSIPPRSTVPAEVAANSPACLCERDVKAKPRPNGAQQFFWGPALGFCSEQHLGSQAAHDGQFQPSHCRVQVGGQRRICLGATVFVVWVVVMRRHFHRRRWGVCKRLRIGSARPRVTPQGHRWRGGVLSSGTGSALCGSWNFMFWSWPAFCMLARRGDGQIEWRIWRRTSPPPRCAQRRPVRHAGGVRRAERAI